MHNNEDYLWSELQLNMMSFTRNYCPQTQKNGHSWVLNQKNVVLLPGKVENKKNAETETWHPERLEECSYYRLCENF